jgi:hypothetical protein
LLQKQQQKSSLTHLGYCRNKKREESEMKMRLGTELIMGLLMAVLLSVLMTEVYAQTPTNTTAATNTTSTTARTAESLAQLRAEDPSFDAFHNIMDLCTDNTLYGNGTISHFQCIQSLQEGVDKWCGIENYHKDKCESASLTLSLYVSTYELFTNLGIGGASGGSLDNPQTPYSNTTPTLSPPPPSAPQQQLTPEQQQQQHEQLKQEDPEFARFDQMVSDCNGRIGPLAVGGQPAQGSPSIDVCQQELDKALAKWCDPTNTATYHAAKCDYVHIIQELWADVLR